MASVTMVESEILMPRRKKSEIKQRYFTLDYWRDGRWYVGRLREVPGVMSQGRTVDQLKRNIIDAYRMIVDEEHMYIPSGNYESTPMGIPL